MVSREHEWNSVRFTGYTIATCGLQIRPLFGSDSLVGQVVAALDAAMWGEYVGQCLLGDARKP
jgi:hypothetical protein